MTLAPLTSPFAHLFRLKELVGQSEGSSSYEAFG
jgi:hypothetical protein